ncbi:hypothetical protein DX130_08275 [Paenibacillus paeoniae]|uniref:Uncharacterized protein n=2 Tax=Paenibacillus paeoniae TaxID=2292705 RepID=A0A371PLB2_9BACL|nr:hypothetical protein DX130_08275 [Paenibacillus paeoniae]
MSWIAEQSYYKVERILADGEMRTIKEPRFIRLYEKQLQTKRRTFPLNEVHDLSYRPMGEEGGILYVHTGHGLYAYTVSDDPAVFMETFKKHKATQI